MAERPMRALAPVPGAGPLYIWNDLALAAARSAPLTDAQAARLYALLNVAIYDAVNGIDYQTGVKRSHALVAPTGAPKKGDMSAAAAVAAHSVMTQARPDLAATYQAQLDADLASLPANQDTADGMTWGLEVANQVLALRQNDGSSPNQSQPAGAGPGVFRASWSGIQFQAMTPFGIVSAAPYVSAGPPALDSADYAAAWAEVKTLGAASVQDPAALETFQFWASSTGTVQPPGEWIKVALGLADARGHSLAEGARMLALVSMAMADAVIPITQSKVLHRAWRPATAIREADTDGNAATTADVNWSPRAGGIGTSPEHVSGHSGFAGAATTVFRGLLCDDAVSFTLLTDSAPAGARTYASFTDAEAEAGRSRILGGIHFEFSNQAGLQTGRGVGAEILATRLLRVNGQTHHGVCPK